MFVRLSLVVALLMLLSACSDSEPVATSSVPDPAVTTTAPSDPPGETTASTTGETTSTTDGDSTTTTPPATTTTTGIAGEVVEGFGPSEGDRLMVIGVAFDDVLNLRELPGVGQTIISTIPPTDVSVFAEGVTRDLGSSWWIEVEHQNFQGWVNFSFVGYEGQTIDATSAYVAEVGAIPVEETMLDLGMLVAESSVSEEPASRVTVVVAPTSGDLGEITIDVIGLGDDALLGMRLHIFGQPTTDGFSLKSIEQTFICGRGVTADGLCL